MITHQSISAPIADGAGGGERSGIEHVQSTRWRGELALQLLFQAATLNIGNDGDCGAIRAVDTGKDDFIPKVLADVVDLVNEFVKVLLVVSLAVRPPLLQPGALIELVLKDRIGLVEELAEVGNADIKQSVRRHARQKIAAAARLRERELCDAVLDKSELRHDADILLLISTPCKLLL